MTDTFSSIIAELMKGCGTISKGKVKDMPFFAFCGNDSFKGKICLCNVCREKLDAYKKAQKLVEDAIKKLEYGEEGGGMEGSLFVEDLKKELGLK